MVLCHSPFPQKLDHIPRQLSQLPLGDNRTWYMLGTLAILMCPMPVWSLVRDVSASLATLPLMYLFVSSFKHISAGLLGILLKPKNLHRFLPISLKQPTNLLGCLLRSITTSGTSVQRGLLDRGAVAPPSFRRAFRSNGGSCDEFEEKGCGEERSENLSENLSFWSYFNRKKGGNVVDSMLKLQSRDGSYQPFVAINLGMVYYLVYHMSTHPSEFDVTCMWHAISACHDSPWLMDFRGAIFVWRDMVEFVENPKVQTDNGIYASIDCHP